MRWTRWFAWFRRRSDDDFAEEIESHLAMEQERLQRSGMSAEDARFAARRAFGNATARREEFHESRAGHRVESLAQDVRYGLRSLRHAPAFTAIAVASFAIGIGANTTMFGAIDALLIRTPAHVRDAGRVQRIYFEYPTPGEPSKAFAKVGYRTFASLRDHVKSFESVGAFWTTKVSSGRGADARQVAAVVVTPSVFTLLGVRPALGRFFTAEEERDENEHVAVIGYEAWRAWYNGDSTVLGRTIDVGGVPHVIVGVAPDGFTGVDPDRVDLWLPLGVANRLFSPGIIRPRAGGYWLEMIAKRQARASVEQAAREVTQTFRNEWRDEPRYEEEIGKAFAVLGPIVAARGPAGGSDAAVSRWVAAVSLLVLLIAAVNVANLLLLRGLTRSREIALRLSLGATRWRVMRQMLVEGALLTAAGAICAVVLARWSASAMLAFLLPHAVTGAVFSARMLMFTALIAIGAGLLAAVMPALVTARRDFGPLLGTGRAAANPHRVALQRTLIAVQVALATLLLVGAGLFVTSLRNVHAIDLGIDVDHTVYVNLDFGAAGEQHRDSTARAAVTATYQSMLERVRHVPGVSHASLTAGEPLASGWGISLQRRGAPEPRMGTPVPFGRAVGTDYFETMGTSLVRGRLFMAADHMPGAHVAIIDETAAKQYLPGGNGLDPCVYLGNDQPCTQIVGVVKSTVLWEMTGTKGSIVYVPLEAWPEQRINMMEIRTTGDPRPLVPALRQAVLSVSSDLPWADIVPVSERLAPQLRPWRLGASMFTAFGVLALCLAAVGLYGLLSYVVTQRTQEIGIRKALGAPSGGVVQLVLRGALAMTVAGVTIGIVAALAAGRLIASQLYGVSSRNPTVIAASAVVLVVVAIVASLAPAIRATRVDPLVALRAE